MCCAGKAISEELASTKLTEPQRYESFLLVPCEDAGTDNHGFSNMALRINGSHQFQCTRTMGFKTVQSAWNAELSEIRSLLTNLKEQVNSNLVGQITEAIARFPKPEAASGPAVAPAVREPAAAPAQARSSDAPTSAEAFAPSASTPSRHETSHEQWVYMSASGLEGPFPTSQMRDWYESGFFPDNLYVASVNVDSYDSATFRESDMQTIHRLWQYGTASNAFRSDPMSWAELLPADGAHEDERESQNDFDDSGEFENDD